MSLTLLLVALAHAVGVLLVASVSRSRGWTVLAAVVAATVAIGWGHPQDVAEKWLAIALAYWACWRMLPRRKFPRTLRAARSGRTRVRGPAVVVGLGSLVLMVTMLAVVTGLPPRMKAPQVRIPAVAVPAFSSNSPTTATQKPPRVLARSVS
jgi:hypothetical protein